MLLEGRASQHYQQFLLIFINVILYFFITLCSILAEKVIEMEQITTVKIQEERNQSDILRLEIHNQNFFTIRK